MTKKHRTLLRILFVLFLMSVMVLGNTQVGKTQSDSDWSTPVNLSSSGIATTPAMVVDFRGTIHVIWVDSADEGYRYSRSSDGIKWTFPAPIKFPFKIKDSLPVLLADSNGSIHIFWIDERNELYYGQTKPEDFGDPTKWITTAKLSNGASNFDVAIDSQGILHLAYIENVTDELAFAGVYYRQSTIGGGSWLEARKIEQSEYFRATTSLNTYIRVAVSDKPDKSKIYVSWDNRPQKRIYIATSEGTGRTWSAAQQFKGPDDTGGFGSPFNISVWVSGDNLLLMWQVGEPGASKCSVYSQWSKDAGNTWGDIVTLFGGPAICPASIKFVASQNDKVVVLMKNLGDPILAAWDGSQWSDAQLQTTLPSLSNPATYDTILLGCRQDVIYKDKLFVVGCDQAKGGDVWFLSRMLAPVDDWFSPSSFWSAPVIVEGNGKKITFLSSVSDAVGHLHAVWVETSTIQDDSKPSIQYSRWDGTEWSAPETIIRNLDGVPLYLTMYNDSQNRLMLAWVDGSKGDLLFSWANLDQANLLSGWEEATVLPSPSQLNSSPDIVVDSSGRIVVAYAVPLNENRGVYAVQSVDNGLTWSPYVQVFNAILPQWEMVDNPKIALSGDGRLHLLFTRQSIRADQPLGLYYSQSQDGGVTWNDPQVVSEGKIYWSDIVAYDQQTVHRLWQEDNGLVVANLSQVSQDGGISWGKLLDVTGVSENTSLVTLATNDVGDLYFVQLLQDNVVGIANTEKLHLQEWGWDGSHWNSGPAREWNIKGSGTQFSVAAGVTSKKYLGVSLSVEYLASTGVNGNEMISTGRFLENVDNLAKPVLSIIPTPFFAPNQLPVDLSEITQTPAVDLTILNESNDPSQGLAKNLIGVGLITMAVVAILLLLIRRNPKKDRHSKNTN